MGCKLNFAETSTIGKQFLDNGFSVTDFNNEADVYVINTCTVTDGADKECRQIIRRAQRNNPEGFIIVTGCYAQLRSDEIVEIENPGTRGWLGELFNVTVYDRVLSSDELLHNYSLGIENSGNSSPTIVSIPVTEAAANIEYVYDVVASGIPSPTFSLDTAPSGMDINAATGRITWIPSTSGTYPVVVVATNSEGFDTQSFDITIDYRLAAYWKLDETGSPTTFADAANSNDGGVGSGKIAPLTGSSYLHSNGWLSHSE